MRKSSLLLASALLLLSLPACKKGNSPAPVAKPKPKDSTAVVVKPNPKDSTIVLTGITIARTGQTYPTLNAAVGASQDNDVIQVPKGTYVNDVVNITKKLTIKGIGGMAKFTANTPPPNGKAIFLANNDITLDHIEMSGCTVADNNGAGIKQESGYLTLTYCYFHDNQDGVLSNAQTSGITIQYCEFAHNGAGDGYSHNLYIGASPKAIIQNSYFHDAVAGHEVKCRALSTLIENCRIQNGSGSASYCIDLPQGGASIVKNDTIEKGMNAQNPNAIHFGGEAVNPGSSLLVSSVLFVSAKTGYVFVANQMADGSSASLTSNNVFGIDDSKMLSGIGTVTGTTHLTASPVLNRSSLFPQ